jgi:hypothetical protein
MSDFESLKHYIAEYNRFVRQEINELPMMAVVPKNKEYLELYTLLHEGSETFKAKRNGENILFGQLGLGLFALQMGNFIPIRIDAESTSMVAETIDYFNRFVAKMGSTSEEIRVLSEAVQQGDFTYRISEGGVDRGYAPSEWRDQPPLPRDQRHAGRIVPQRPIPRRLGTFAQTLDRIAQLRDDPASRRTRPNGCVAR